MNDYRNTAENAASEYLPHGSQSSNGKAFVLAHPKSPEEIARDEIRKTMPRLRRECSRDARLIDCVGAKWLFGVLTDLSFLNDYGGDGFGRIYISTHDLQRIFGHRRESFAAWRDKLMETGWIWFQDMWPKSCWGITSVCRQPELFPPHSCFVRQMAKASGNTLQETQPSLTASLHQDVKTADSGQNCAVSPPDWPAEPAILAGGTGQTSRRNQPHWPAPTASMAPESRPDWPAEPARLAAGDGMHGPPVTAGTADGTGHIKESPLEIGSQETQSQSSLTGETVNGSPVDERKGASKKANKEAEEEFLALCSEVFDRPTMKKWGGYWRKLFRDKPGKARRVIWATKEDMKTKAINNPGGYARDLWNRFA